MKIRNLTVGLSLLLLCGCASAMDATITLNYTPASLAEVPAAIKVEEFTRDIIEEVEANQYETTGYTFNKQISLTEPLADYVKSAVVQELRRAGSTARQDNACELTANISKMGLHYEGSKTVTFNGILSYKLTSESGDTYTKDVEESLTAPTSGVETSHSKFITSLVDALIMDDDFNIFTRSNCSRI